MAKVKYDVSNTDFGASGGEQPKPGLYRAKVQEINPGFSKGEDGKPDKSRPRLEVITKIEGYSPQWTYLSFSEASEWKLANFLEAFGVATPKKRKGSFDTDEIVGKECTVKIRAGKDLNGEYRAEVGTFLALKDEDEEEDEDLEEEESEEEEDEDGDDEDSDDEDSDEDEEDEDEEDEEDDVPYEEWSIPELKEELKARELSTSGKKKALIERLEEDDEAYEEGDEEDEDEEEDGDDPF